MNIKIPLFRSPVISGWLILRLLVFVLMAVLLNSCVAGPHGSYYKPSYPDNSVTFVKRDCRGLYGPLSKMKIPVSEGFISVSLGEHSQDEPELWMYLEQFGGSTLQFTSNMIRFSDLKDGNEWTIEAGSLAFNHPPQRAFLPARVVDFEKFLPAAPEYIMNNVTVRIPFSIEGFSRGSIEIQLPPILTGSEEFGVPPIVLHSAKENEDMDKSWGSWSYRWDELQVDHFKIEGYATGAYKGSSEIGSSKIDARLRALDQSSQLNGAIKISFPADTQWRFATNEIRFEDISSGDIRKVNFPLLEADSDIEVAFTAPFCCFGNAVMRGLKIGNARPEKLRIEIPPLLIDGKEFIIKPIIFDLRRFEFGIYPLNC